MSRAAAGFCMYFSIQCSRGGQCCILIAGHFPKIVACAKVAQSSRLG